MSNTYSSSVAAVKSQSLQLKAVIILLMMIVAAGSAILLKPQINQEEHFSLETIVPKKFAQWNEDDSYAVLQVSQDKQAVLSQVYSQNLSRTYLDNNRNRIMLSIAYGSNQSDSSMRVHKPEVCYYDQGYQVQNLVNNNLQTDFGLIATRRMLAYKGGVQEPVTYWIKTGDTIVFGLKSRLVQLKYGLKGEIPHGLVFRVSSIGDEASAYKIQEKFIRDLLAVLSPEDRVRLTGKTSF